ncbi:methionine aminopeptidase, type I [Raineyella antarctica]|uniref:Methionine aminopeptidase n=1 Tax=Raineyella antarctica TaxID=1577474 RepID=A0A1G6HYU8_9ACTN|nr:type I methionyl aminopeptidase [Raineyella antarctica]SDB99401.1 methionine aminopeptidase, type I [Raineyella antarctica]
MFRSRGIEIKTDDQLRLMRRAGLVVAEFLDAISAQARPGVTLRELDQVGRDVLAHHGADSNFLEYGADSRGLGGFKGVACLSVNQVIVHGMPTDEPLADGDILSIDGGAIIDGWHGDAARTVQVGTPSPANQALAEATEGAMWAGIAAARLNGRIGDIGAAVEAYATSAPGGPYGIVREYVGHGIGTEMHQAPDVPNFGRAGKGPRITRGMAFCIEPMLTLGEPDNAVLDDDWTVVTLDGRPAAHWEHTVTCTAQGVWVLTAHDGGEEMLGRLGVPFGPLAD